MSKPYYAWIDQNGAVVFARTRTELHVRAGGGRVAKIYRDTTDGKVIHVGYVVGQRWFERFAPVPIGDA